MDTRHAERRLAARRFSKVACGEQGGERLSLMHPRFNLRECAKQMLLLEDHLQHPYKHCPDCIRKHLMTIEAFAEEATTLDTVGVFWGMAEELAEYARYWLEDFEDGKPLPEIAQWVRVVRKKLVLLVADPRDGYTRVASRYLAATTPCPHRRVDLGG
jgi:hypothetical protein